MPNICIVIPCYNEENRLPGQDFLNYLNNTNSNVTFCFVNDGSKDKTITVLKDLQNQNSEGITIIDSQVNTGKAEAIRVGINKMLDVGRYDYIGYFDADLATPLSEIERFMVEFRANPSVKMVMGSRVKRLGANIKRYETRHYLGRIFATMASIILNLGVYDTQCGAKIISLDIAPDLFSSKFITRWLFDIEIIARLKSMRPNVEDIIVEVPLKTWQDIAGSKLNYKYMIRVPFDLLRIKRKYSLSTS